jgi:hypothetical protein
MQLRGMLAAATFALLLLQTPDSVLRVRGFVQVDPTAAGDSTRAEVLFAYPLTIGGVRIGALRLPGDAGHWSRYVDRYVEAEGRMLPPLTLSSPRLREVSPAGETRRDVSPSFLQHAALTLSVVPNRIVWRDSAGAPSGVVPVAYFTLTNHGEAPLEFLFSSTDVLCISVGIPGSADPIWREAWRPPHPNTRVSVQMGAVVRYLVPIPERAAPTPGRYTTRVSLCGVSDYEANTEFEVAAPGSTPDP